MQTLRISAKKGSNSRILPVSLKAIEMLSNLPQKKARLFSKADSMRTTLFLQRRRIAKRLATPELNQISFKTFRHWKGPTEQHKTKDPWHVKMILGHKGIKSTETYIHIEKMIYQSKENDQFTVKVADTLEDAVKLMEVGLSSTLKLRGIDCSEKGNDTMDYSKTQRDLNRSKKQRGIYTLLRRETDSQNNLRFSHSVLRTRLL